MAIPKIEVEVTADADPAKRDIKRLGDEFGIFFNKVGRATDQSGKFIRVTDEVRRKIKAAGIDFAGASRHVGSFSDQLANVDDNVVRLPTSVTRAQRSFGGLQRGVQNAAFQVGDFAVQVGAGTDAMRAAALQLPQFLGGFGTVGAVLGAVAAIALPLAAAMRQVNTEGGNMAEIFGTLQPLAEGVATAVGAAAGAMVGLAELVVNNIDRIITIGATAAALFAGRWVAGFVAARIATFSLATSLVVLRGALIRTGIGALIVGAGELVFQFTRLVSAAGSFGGALALLRDVALEVFERIKDGFGVIPKAVKAGAAAMSRFFIESLADMTQSFSDFTWNIAQGLNDLFGTNLSGLSASVTHEMEGLAQTAILASSSAEKALRDQIDLASAPLESIQKIRDLLAEMKEGEFSLDDIIFGGGDDDGSGQKKTLDEKLSEQAKRIQEHFDLIKGISEGSLSDQLGGWQSYFDNLVNLTGSSNEKLLRIGRAFASAQALIDAWGAFNKVLNDPSLPWYARIAAAGSVLSAGIGAVNAIKSVNSSGGGAASAAASGSSAAASPATQNVILDLRNASADTTLQVEGLVDLINEAGRDGYVLDIRTTG